ncbi:MAG: S53 family peptidase [Vulcanimicrobiaceae bacterium]
MAGSTGVENAYDGRIAPWPNVRDTGPAARDETVVVALWLRGEADDRIAPERADAIGALTLPQRAYDDRAELLRATDTAPVDVAAVTAYVCGRGLRVAVREWRCLYVEGTIAAFESLFSTNIRAFGNGVGRTFARRASPIRLPIELAACVVAVVGLDAWPEVQAMHRSAYRRAPNERRSAVPPPPIASLSAEETVTRYNFPRDRSGRGERIGILRFGGTIAEDDLVATMRANGVGAPHLVRRDVEAMPHDRPDARMLGTELAIDVSVAGIYAPDATLVLYGTSHGERGFLRAIAAAIFDEVHRPATLSISYGWPERRWTADALRVMERLFTVAALVGISVFVASGDRGAAIDENGPNVFAPASSRFVHACGGTVVANDVETPWPESGGGFSAYVARPSWQRHACSERRGTPDLSAQCDPGYTIVHRGERTAARETSAVAPLMAAVVARLNEGFGKPCGFFAPLLYAGYDTTSSVRRIEANPGDRYRSPDGWSSTIGLGVPDGAALASLLAGE